MIILSEQQAFFLQSDNNLKIVFSPVEKKPILDYDDKLGVDVIISYEVRKPYNITDDLGGNCFGYFNETTAFITSINSGEITQRGFYKNAISLLKQHGATHIKVILQSNDSRIALSKLLQSEILKNPTNLRGISVDLHPTKFEIS
jgi:hypothetical protein